MSVLHAKGIQVALAQRQILAGVDGAFASGQLIGLIGANGAGKTTLLRSLAGLQPPTKGEVLLDEEVIVQGRSLARKMTYLEQRPASQWALTVEEVVALGRMPHIPWGNKLGKVDAEAVELALQETDTLTLRYQPIHHLSGGEQARIFLARALATQPQWLLADEPVAGLDPAQQLRIMALLRQKAGQGMGVIVSLHDLTLARRFCDRLLLLHQGEVVAEGAPDTVLTAQYLAESYGISAYYGEHEGEGFLVPWRPLSKG